MRKIIFTGGGSAGHVVPNVALMEELLSIGAAEIGYIGTNGIEKQIIAPLSVPYFQIRCPKLIRSGSKTAIKNNLKIPKAFFTAVQQAKTALRSFQPDVVFSKGGYVGLPVVLAAKKLRIPCYAHESDLTLGLANKLSAPFCQHVFTSFPETAEKLKKGIYSGAPIRRAVFAYTQAEARRLLHIPFCASVILVFGGGSGSQAINEALRAHLPALTQAYTILHVCGKGNVIKTTQKNYQQFEFIADMGMLYAAADMVIARSGAGTVFEVMALKKPALFIPLEGQTRGDQVQNAEYFEKQGLCRILRQAQLSALPQAIEKTFSDSYLHEQLVLHDFAPGNTCILKHLLALAQKE